MELIDYLIKEGWLKTPSIIKAFQQIKRQDFLLEDLKDLAELNEALPIGKNQTISQPLVVAFMLEELQPNKGEKILDVGSGSGWTTALLAEIVGSQGKIIALETIPELVEFGKQNVAKYIFIKKGIVNLIYADGSKGYIGRAPFDKILASAAVQGKIPQAWREQLKTGGRIVAPVGSSIWLLIKKSEGDEAVASSSLFQETEYPGFAFVPLVEK